MEQQHHSANLLFVHSKPNTRNSIDPLHALWHPVPMLKPIYFVAFTGHRPDGSPGRTDEALEATADFIEIELLSLKRKTEQVGGQLHFISGIAAGADIVACEVAKKLNIPLHIILPKEPAEFFRAFPQMEHWEKRSRALLAYAMQENLTNTMRIGSISGQSPDCYAEANARMLEVADALLTVSTGDPSKSVAGASHLADQANILELPLITINPLQRPSEQAVTRQRIEKFAKHDSASLHIFQELKPYMNLAEAQGTTRFDKVASSLGKAAGNSSKSFRSGTAWAIILHALAGFLAAGVASFYYTLKKDAPSHTAYIILAVFALVEFALVGWGCWLEWRNHRSTIQRTWLHCRFARELMRGIKDAQPFLDPLYPEVRRHLAHWKRFAISASLFLQSEQRPADISDEKTFTAARNHYVSERIATQLNHFQKKSTEAKLHTKRFLSLAHWAGPAAFVVVLFACLVKWDDLLYHGHHKPDWLNAHAVSAFLLLFLPILIPLLASLSFSFLASFDFRRRAVRYEEMAISLKRAARWLPTLSSTASVNAYVQQTEELLLDELIEWLASQQSGFGH